MSATVIVRRIVATPSRSAAEVWKVVAQLLAPEGSPARSELDRIGGIAMAIIAAEAPRTSPIIISGSGPRLRLYCLYEEDAVLGTDASEDPLPWCPTEGEWEMSLPCSSEDLTWVCAALAEMSNRVTAHDVVGQAPQEQDGTKGQELGPIDVEAFLRR